MYKTEALWGLEDNRNAVTINNTFNNATNLVPVLITVVVVIAGMLALSTRKGFG